MKKILEFGQWTGKSEKTQLGGFSVTWQERGTYEALVRSKLSSIYNNFVEAPGPDGKTIKFIGAQSFDTEGRWKSIINYADSNNKLANWIVYNFKCKSFQDLINTVNREYQNLYSPDGKWSATVLEKLKETEESGIRNEVFATEMIKKDMEQKGKQVQIKRTVTDSWDDCILGIDLILEFSGRKFTCQVKPYTSINIQRKTRPGLGFYEIQTPSKVKAYKVDYMVFVNTQLNSVFVFENNGLKTNWKSFTLPESSLKSEIRN